MSVWLSLCQLGGYYKPAFMSYQACIISKTFYRAILNVDDSFNALVIKKTLKRAASARNSSQEVDYNSDGLLPLGRTQSCFDIRLLCDFELWNAANSNVMKTQE